MAITILQTPDNPNVSNTNLIYTVSSSNVPQFQYRYIADLYESGSATRLARFKYPQNSSGTANIDVGRPIGDYLDNTNNWEVQFSSASNTVQAFEIQFGEEYGTSYTSPVTVFTNVASASINVFKGNIQYPTIAAYDTGSNTVTLQSSSINYNSLENQSNSVGNYSDGNLSNNPALNIAPATSKYRQKDTFAFSNQWWWKQLWVSSSTPFYSTQPVGLDDYATEHWLSSDKVESRLVLFNDNNERIWYGDIIDQSAGTYANELISTVGTGLANLAAVENLTQLTASLGTGPLSASISSSNQWNWYCINTYGGNTETGTPHFYYNEDKGADNLISITTGSTSDFLGRWGGDVPPLKPSLWANKYYPTYCKGEKTRFAFTNSFGVWDYYNVYMPTRRSTNIDRKMYEQERINLNDRIATYNVSNRGEVQYYTEYTDEFEITTDIIDDKESQWLREMFESSDVFIQSGSDFIPINILNNTETIINNKARNKNYQYTIRYQFSNLREPR